MAKTVKRQVIVDADQFSRKMENDGTRYDAWSKNYDKIHPKPSVTLEQLGFGFDFKLLIGVAVSLIIGAAMRTGMMFYAAEKASSARWLGSGADGLLVEAISFLSSSAFMIGIDGGLFVIALIAAKNSTSEKPSSLLLISFEILVGSVSFMAGIGQGIGLLETISESAFYNFTVSLVIALAAGATLGSIFCGRIAGIYLRDYEMKKKAALKEMKDEIKQWQDTRTSRWEEYIANEERLLSASANRDEETEKKPKVYTPLQEKILGVIGVMIEERMAAGNANPPTPTEIVARLKEIDPNDKTPISYAHKMKAEWLEANKSLFETGE